MLYLVFQTLEQNDGARKLLYEIYRRSLIVVLVTSYKE